MNRNLKKFKIETKDLSFEILTDKPILEALEDECKKGKMPFSKLGQIINIVHPDGENRPIATIPFLYGRDLITKETAVLNIKSMFQISDKEAEKMLLSHNLTRRF